MSLSVDFTSSLPALSSPLLPSVITVQALADYVDGDIAGDANAEIRGISSIEDATPGDIVFAENGRFLTKAERSGATAIVTFMDAESPSKSLIRVENPRFSFARILEIYKPKRTDEPGVHPSAVVGENATFGEGASIGPNATLGRDVAVGANSIIMSGCHIGDGVKIGSDCIIHPNVAIYHGTILGNGVTIHSCTVIGADGFGYMPIGDKLYKVPQIGNVEIGDDVEIGANCCIDRAKTGSTVIGARTKIDNLVQIAHNVKTGSDCIVVAQVGIAGSATLGNRVTMAGQSAVKDHVTIHDDVLVMGRGAVFGDLESGQIVSGYPARPHRHKMRLEGLVDKLPETVKRIKALEEENVSLQKACERLTLLTTALAKKLGIEEAE